MRFEIDGRRPRSYDALKCYRDRNGSLVTDLNAPDNTAKSEPLFGLVIVNNVPRQLLSVKSDENGWLVPQKHSRPFEELIPVVNFIVSRPLKVEHRNGIQLPAIAQVGAIIGNAARFATWRNAGCPQHALIMANARSVVNACAENRDQWLYVVGFHS